MFFYEISSSDILGPGALGALQSSSARSRQDSSLGVPRARATMPMVIRKAPPKVDKTAEAAALEAANRESARAARKEAKRALKKLQAVSTLTQTAVVTTDESQQSLQQPEALTESQEAMVDRADRRLRRDPGFTLLPPGPRARRLAEHTSLPLDRVIWYLSQQDDSFLKALQDTNAPAPPGPGAANVAITAIVAAIPGASAKAQLLKSPVYSDLT